jgi:hypothetical protein
LAKFLQNWYYAKSSLRIGATFVIFNYLAKENNRPMGENSPNLVTLLKTLVEWIVGIALPWELMVREI